MALQLSKHIISVVELTRSLATTNTVLQSQEICDIADYIDGILTGFIAVKGYDGPTIGLWAGVAKIATIVARIESGKSSYEWTVRGAGLGGKASYGATNSRVAYVWAPLIPKPDGGGPGSRLDDTLCYNLVADWNLLFNWTTLIRAGWDLPSVVKTPDVLLESSGMAICPINVVSIGTEKIKDGALVELRTLVINKLNNMPSALGVNVVGNRLTLYNYILDDNNAQILEESCDFPHSAYAPQNISTDMVNKKDATTFVLGGIQGGVNYHPVRFFVTLFARMCQRLSGHTLATAINRDIHMTDQPTGCSKLWREHKFPGDDAADYWPVNPNNAAIGADMPIMLNKYHYMVR